MLNRLCLLLASLLLVSFTATGCLEEKQELTLQPDGSGTLRFERTMGTQMSSMTLGFAAGKKPAEVAEEFAVGELSDWQGIDAWTDIDGAVKDGRLHISATGWFKDVTQVSEKGSEGPMGGTSYHLERGEGTLTLRRIKGAEEEGEEDGNSDMFESSDEEFNMQRGMVKGMLAGMLDEMRLEYTVAMPGEVQSAKGLKPEGNNAGLLIEGQLISQMLDKVFDIVTELRPKVKAGDMTVAEAELELNRKIATEFDLPNDEEGAEVVAACAGDAASEEFQKGLAEALSSWKDSDWAKKVATHRASEAGEVGGPEEPEDEVQRPDTSPPEDK